LQGDPFPAEYQYKISFDSTAGKVTEESLETDGKVVYESQPAADGLTRPIRAIFRKPFPPQEFDRFQPILCQLGRGENGRELRHLECNRVAKALGNMQRIDPVPEVLRGYSQAQQIRRMGERGENFAALVKTLCENASNKEAFEAWLRELRPAEVDEVTTLKGALGEPLFALKERGKTYPAPVLSDGTLRFAAIAAAFFQPDLPGILTIEEIEKGIHASRLRLLLEMLKNRTQSGGVQVMATTHSRSLLDWLDTDDYKTTFFCQRIPETGESRIVPLSEVPHLSEATGSESLGDLFAENWLEAAL
jgi:predicted ATPase